ncbi:hypothetical protein [Jiangella rhizosphaerae]|uniref:Uncharacterized protein n=1 Tax=Jiangella rhizosphaerae TaxID=2293569 RepID=A0A418KLN2_9ACTN|nr:hypothetical protein [Jiangella rhizosphaerae]RIQ18835.1 hypothetical protein DY240_20920 [Jiangella rhizosphaerae]
MSRYRKWRDTDRLERAVETAGGPEIFDDEFGSYTAGLNGWRLVADLVGVPVQRVVDQVRWKEAISAQELIANDGRNMDSVQY